MAKTKKDGKKIENNMKIPSLGTNIKRLRTERGWNAQTLCDVLGMKQSRLSKIENGLLSLSYNQLAEVAEKLEIDIAELFRHDEQTHANQASVARMVIDRAKEDGLKKFKNTRYCQLATDMKNRLMVATYTEIVWEEGEEVNLVAGGYPGERFIYIIEGTVDFHSEFYETITLNAGDSTYFDIRMKHSASTQKGKVAKMIVITTSDNKKFMETERALASKGLSNILELDEGL